MIDLSLFQRIVEELERKGWAAQDISWAENIIPPGNAQCFADETIFVIVNSGMRFTVARKIYDRIMPHLYGGRSSSAGCGHKGKCAAIDHIWANRQRLFDEYLNAEDKLAFLETLPWIGPITVMHLGKNLGLDLVKPDVHLQRLADLHQVTPDALCRSLAEDTGYRIGTIDTLLWRACATGVLCSRTGRLLAED